MKKIKIRDIEIFFTKRHRQKNIRLSVQNRNKIILSAPFLCSEKKAVLFAEQHFDWIKSHINIAPFEKKFSPLDSVSILGKSYQIIYDKTKKSGIQIDDNKLYVGGELDFIHRRISNYAKKELLNYIQKKAFCMAKLIDKKPHSISLKNTTSRWGSCSSKNNLNFCWKIAFAPLYVIDYLIAHEVSHLKEMNHSPKFWETVALFNTEQAKAEIWLRKNGKNLITIK